MALLKSDVKRVTIYMPKDLLKELDEHLKKFAFGVRSQWLIEAIIERMAREKNFLSERETSSNE